MQQIVVGTCDGTGAAINVCLGFKPSLVEVWNLDDTTDLPHLVWHKSMAAITTATHGVLDKTIAGVVKDDLATAGISHYAGGAVLTWDAAQSRWETSAGADASEVYLDGYYNREASTDAAYQCYGTKVYPDPRDGATVTTVEGFTIGTNADINVDGQQLVFMAIR